MKTAIAFACIAITLAAFQLFFLAAKFPLYRQNGRYPYATWLRDVGNFRIGAIRGQHGAIFVRIPPGEPFTTVLPDDDDGKVRQAMLRDLPRTPAKAVGEYAMYLVLFFGCLWLLPSLLARRMRWSFAVAVSCFAAVLLAQIPLFFRYDSSIFSTWSGPGAYSSSGGYLRLTYTAGYSVSYRPFLESLLLPALRSLAAVHLLPYMEGPAGWFIYAAEVCCFYGVLGALLGGIADVVRQFIRPSNSTIADL